MISSTGWKYSMEGGYSPLQYGEDWVQDKCYDRFCSVCCPGVKKNE